MYKISIIIPIYNAEDTIERSIQSVLNQEWNGDFNKDIQLILVDDCSIDNTKSILDDYANKYSNVFSYSTPQNTGCGGMPRNIGLDVSNAEYIMFLDADDIYCPNMCQTLYDEINEFNYDLVCCDYVNIDNIGKLFIHHDYIKKKKLVFNNDERYYFSNIVVWDKIFVYSIIKENNLHFSNNRYAEDQEFIYNYYKYSSSCFYLKDFFGVNRFIQENSVSRTTNIKEHFKQLDLYYKQYNYLKNKNLNLSKVFKKNINFFISEYYVSNVIGNSKKDIFKFFDHLCEFEKKIEFNESIGFVNDFANNLILKRKFNLAFLFLKFMRIIFKISFFRKLSRL